jgi:hypothetical protein
VRDPAIQKEVAGYGSSLDGTYEGGHIVRTQLGGPPERLNMFPQTDQMNRSSGLRGVEPVDPNGQFKSYYAFETDAARNPGKYTDIDITLDYDPHLTGTDVDKVPREIEITGKEYGKPMPDQSFPNRAGRK